MFVTRLFLRCRSSLCARNLNYRPWTCILSFLAWFACLNLNVRNPVFNAFTPQALFSPARVRLKRHSWQFCRKSSCADVQQGGQKKRFKITEFDPRGRCRAAGGGCRRGARARPRQRPGGGGCARATPPSTGGCSSSRPPPAALDSPYVRAKQVQVIQNSTHVYHFGCV
jgi:hypothetical protein